MTRWSTSVDPEVLEKAKGTVPEGVTLTGVHPQASAAWKSIPSACINCHKARAHGTAVCFSDPCHSPDGR